MIQLHYCTRKSHSPLLVRYDCDGVLFETFQEVSVGYFLYDLTNCYNDPLFILHHLVAIVTFVMTGKINNPVYNWYYLLLVIVGEFTGILQNWYFHAREGYGDNKIGFYEDYFTFFHVFYNLFIVARLIFLPTARFFLLRLIKEPYFFYTIFISGIGICYGSFRWVQGQQARIQKMRREIKAAHASAPVSTLTSTHISDISRMRQNHREHLFDIVARKKKGWERGITWMQSCVEHFTRYPRLGNE